MFQYYLNGDSYFSFRTSLLYFVNAIWSPLFYYKLRANYVVYHTMSVNEDRTVRSVKDRNQCKKLVHLGALSA